MRVRVVVLRDGGTSRVARTDKPVHILWDNIPDPQAKTWGECSEVYLGDMGIIATLTVKYGVSAMKRAFMSARQARF